MKKSNLGPIILIIIILISGISLVIYKSKQPGKYDKLAQCITDSGAKFYGAFWCPHCQKTKAMFGKSAKLIPYVECSKPNGQGQLPICEEKGIKGYPTWIFSDGSQLNGEQKLEDLAEKTNCQAQYLEEK